MYSIKFTVINFHSAVLSHNLKNVSSFWQGHLAGTDKLQTGECFLFLYKRVPLVRVKC